MKIRDIIIALAAAGTTLAAVAVAQTQSPQPQAKARITSAVYDWAKIEAHPTSFGSHRSFFDGPTATLENFECHVTTLNPGESPHPAHRHPNEEFVVIREGTLEVTLNGKSQVAGPGSVLFFASNDLHGLRNVGTTSATYHVFSFVTAATPRAGD
jgi:quercetin dioxygenase-like cupin family protein